MAEIATLIEIVLGEGPDVRLPQFPMRELTLTNPDEAVASGWTTPILGNRFPTPPSAVGFLARLYDIENPPVIVGLKTPYLIRGAIDIESPYIEPNRGQIWPRIG